MSDETPRGSAPPGIPPTTGPCGTGRRDTDPQTRHDPDADRAAAARLPGLTEPVVRVRAVDQPDRAPGRRRLYRVDRRRATLSSRQILSAEYFVMRLDEERRYLGWIPVTHSVEIYSLHASRLELVARVFLGTGHVPAEEIL